LEIVVRIAGKKMLHHRDEMFVGQYVFVSATPGAE